MAREGLSVLPPSLALRKEAEDALAAACAAPSERIARKIITEVNVKIRDMMFRPPPGPPLGMKPYDVEEVVRRWREGRVSATDEPSAQAGYQLLRTAVDQLCRSRSASSR
jgi:hypothetical protein